MDKVSQLHRRAQKAESEVARLRRENDQLRKQLDGQARRFAMWGERKSLPLPQTRKTKP